MVHRLGAIVGYLAWRKSGELRRVVETNIRLCFPRLSPSEQAGLARQNLAESGKLLLEGGKMWLGEVDKTLALVQAVEGERLLEQARTEQRGVILAAPHLGCWEILGLYFARHYAMTAMYADRRGRQLEQLVRNGRQRTGAKLVPDDGSGVRAMNKALKRQELAWIMPDQSPIDSGEFAEFFGQTCYTMTLLPKLASNTNAVVLFAYAKRLPDSSGFQIFVRQASEDIAQLELPAALRVINQDIETLVREAPDQYWWAYRRFKKRPDGARSVY